MLIRDGAGSNRTSNSQPVLSKFNYGTFFAQFPKSRKFLSSRFRSRLRDEPMYFVVNPDEFKLVCESCGSLTVVLPIGSNPDPQEVVTCGRPRGTLLMLRERSLRAGPAPE
jgi:hypothetical protein